MHDEPRRTPEQLRPKVLVAIPSEAEEVEAVNARERLLLEARAVARRSEERLRTALGGDAAVMRKCSHCRKDFTPRELSREESKGMEGVLFRFCVCSACGNADIFVDVRPLGGEPDDAFRRRRGELEADVRGLHGGGVDVVGGK